MRMINHGWWRLALPTIGFLASLSALTAICLAGQDKPQKPTKAPSYPLALFAQAKAEDYIDDKACAECHAAYAESFERSPHALFVRDPKNPVDRQGCQACHGPGKNHVEHLEDPAHIGDFIIPYTKVKPQAVAEACLRCHQDTMKVAQWKRTHHAAADVSCVACHTVHYGPGQKPAEENPKVKTGPLAIGNGASLLKPIFPGAPEPKKLLRADEPTLCGQCHQREINEFRHNSHHPVPEGRMVCSDCHDVHPSRNAQKQTGSHTRLRTAGDKCVGCHGETAGPFAFEHDPVAGWTGEGCTECHRPHGSHNPRLLEAFSRGLCNRCHTDKANNHNPGHTCWDVGCHVALHGSNTDPNLLRR
jgi:predicted CXXCH cytochrome family protein